MAANLVVNVREALTGFPVESSHCWTDSSVVLHWLKRNGDYKQFVANRVRKINAHPDLIWKHVPTNHNHADIGTTDEFLLSLKRFIARRGRPQRIYSDNAGTFVAAAEWLRLVRRSKKFHDY